METKKPSILISAGRGAQSSGFVSVLRGTGTRAMVIMCFQQSVQGSGFYFQWVGCPGQWGFLGFVFNGWGAGQVRVFNVHIRSTPVTGTGTGLRDRKESGEGVTGDRLHWRVQGSTSSPTAIGSRRRVV